MALPKKGSRNITVSDVAYRWMASGNDGWIDVYVELKNAKGPLLKAKFDYHTIEITQEDGSKLKQRFAVTPEIVRQTIELGLQEGWEPLNGKPIDLYHIDDRIELEKGLVNLLKKSES